MTRTMKKTGTAWIREIPADWAVVNIRALFSFGKGLPITKENLRKKGAPVVSYGQIHSKQNNGLEIKPDLVRYVDASYFQSNPESLVKQNDFIFADTSEDLDGCGNCVYVDSKDPVFAGYHTIILRNKTDLNLKYFAFLFQSDAWRKQIRERVTGVKLFSISQRILRETSLLLPPVDEQRRIVRKLSAECARIDAIIEQTRATVEEYKKLKQSIITQAVTKGIRPNRPMKDSGIEWIGEIPDDWEISNLGAISENLRNGYVGPTKDLFYDEGIPYIQSLHIKDGRIDFSRHEYYVSEDWANAHPKIKTDDLLIVQTGDIGNVGLVPKEYNLCNCHALIIATLKKVIVFPEFITFFLRSHVGRELLLFYKTGALLPHLNSGKIKFASICVPKLSEQKEIVDWLNAEEAKIDALICGKETFISELESYKKSLIYEYVTGKKEAPL